MHTHAIRIARGGAWLCTFGLAAGIALAQAKQTAIVLDRSNVSNPANQTLVKGQAPYANPPANFRPFAAAHAGQPGSIESVQLHFTAATTITRIESTKDFKVEEGGSCAPGRSYAAGDTCLVLVRFTPQGAGNRLGKLTITHTASAQPAAFGLGGYGYAPIASFIPALITTVAGTYPSNKGLLSSAQNLTVDGGDTLYIADTGNGIIRYMDSSNTIKSLATGYPSPNGIAVDTFGEVYFDETAANLMYEIYDYGPIVTVSGTTTGSCTVSTPCTLAGHAISSPGEMSMDPYNHLFWVDEDGGAAMSTVQPEPPNLIFLYDPFPYQQSPSAPMSVDSGDNLYTLWANGGTCSIIQQSLYNAENSNQSFNKVAGGRTCGFSGNGGLANNAEIGAKIGQIAFDTAGNLYFSDTNNQRVRRIDSATGIINTIAGNGTAGYGAFNSATNATLSFPTGVAVDSQGQVYIISGTGTTSGGAQLVRKLGPGGYISFSSAAVGTTSAAQVATLSNTGNSTLVLTSYYIGGVNPSDFALDPTTTSCMLTPGSTLYAGQSCKIGIVFKPTTTGSRQAKIVFLDNSVTGSNTIQFSGTATAAAASFTPGSVAFPATTPNQTITTPVTVTNTGNSNLTISAIAVTGTNPNMFTSGGTCGTAPIAPKGSCTLSITFKPAAAASYSATVKITDNTPQSPHMVSVSGSGKATPASIVQVTSSANPASACSAVSFTIKVTSQDATMPTGVVELKSGSTVLGIASLKNGTATFPTTGLAAGSNLLTASYEGDALHGPSNSGVFTQMVMASNGCIAGHPASATLPRGANSN